VSVLDTDVIIAGAGPSGLMLAGELALAGARPLVLERRAVSSVVERASGLGGQALNLLRYRGLLERFSAASSRPGLAAEFPFGSLHVDFTDLPDNPMQAMPLPQPELVRLLAERAVELGATIRYGHEVTGASQDADTVTADVAGPDGPLRLTARYIVGCEGGRSQVRAAAGIPFPGATYPEVNRMGTVAIHDSVTLLDDGGFEVPGEGVVPFGYTHTDNGMLAVAARGTEAMMVYTVEDDAAAASSAFDSPLTMDELAASVRRVLGFDLPMGAPARLTRFAYQARQAERYRSGRMLLAGDAAHLFPAGGQGIGVGIMDAVNLAWKLGVVVGGGASDLLDTYHSERYPVGARALMQCRAQVAMRRGNDAEAFALRDLIGELLTDEPALRRIAALIAGSDIRYPMPGAAPHALAGTFATDLSLRLAEGGTTSVAELMHAARPVLLDLADRADIRSAAGDWGSRVSVVTATADRRPGDALLIRPDAYVAWGAEVSEPGDSAAPALRDALTYWFGTP
jgi:2-polyprenyl-6-methoxyphenol hydroxylase-like FAD-dependent oxidoreductase